VKSSNVLTWGKRAALIRIVVPSAARDATWRRSTAAGLERGLQGRAASALPLMQVVAMAGGGRKLRAASAPT